MAGISKQEQLERKALLEKGLKKCFQCKIVKPLNEYGKDSRGSDGLLYACKECIIAERKAFHLRHPDYQKEYDKNYHIKNKERKAARANTPEAKARTKHVNKEYREKHKERLNEIRRKRREADPHIRIKGVLRCRVYGAITAQNASKTSGTVALLGCTIPEFKLYLESLFEPWMNWDNYGNPNGDHTDCWHIDHIKPCDSFDLTDPEQQLKCFNYTNMRPLGGLDNISKSNTI